MKAAFIIVIFVLMGCSDGMHLGEEYYFADHEIIKGSPGKNGNIGTTVIPPRIQKFNYYGPYIIVNTINSNHESRFWLIDKKAESIELGYEKTDSLYWGWSGGYYKMSNIIGPIDSVTLTEQLSLRKRAFPEKWFYPEN